MCYIGLKWGIGIEIFKLLNLLVCSFVALHFYSILGAFINSKITALPIEPAKIFSYCILCIVITLIFRILREGFFAMMRVESITTANKISGFVLGTVRGIMISGLIVFGLCISTIHYLELSAKTSYLGSKIVHIPTKIYEGTFWGLIHKLSSDQEFNSDIPKAINTE